jgi:hypothetical protein
MENLVQEAAGESSREGQYDRTDLSNGFYPHLRKVGEADPEFQDVLSWLASKGAPRHTRLFAPRGVSTDGSPSLLPTQIEWKMNGFEAVLDAALVFNFPHVALTELKQAFGFGNPNVLEYYPGLRQPVAYVWRTPVGEAWPQQGPNAYRPASGDRSEYGTEYVDQSGRFRKEKRHWMFVSYGVWVKQ